MHVPGFVLPLILLAAGAWPAPCDAVLSHATQARWMRTDTARFEIHYLPAVAGDLDRVSRSAERAYDLIGARLNFALATKVPLIVFRQTTAVPRQAVVAYAASEDVAPNQPHRSRIVLPISESDAELDVTLVHELTHLLYCEIILPSQPGTGGVPRWVSEGLAHYMVGQWSEADMTVMRTLVAANGIPALSRLTDDSPLASSRVHDVIGHAAFDYIEGRWGRPGIRRFVDGLIVPRTDATYASVLDLAPQAFDAAFRQYAQHRFAAEADVK